MQRFMTHRRCAFTIALTTVAFFPSIFIPGGSRVLGQDAVGVLHEVRIVDTSEGQDVEFAITARPADVLPVQRDSCTFAVELPNVVPGPEVTSQFFRSELVQNLTVRAATDRAATEICVETAVPVRSRVALRATGMTMRLTPLDTSSPPEARPADDPRVTPSDAVPESASVSPVGADTADASNVNRARELTLALREERVARRELQLEVADLRRQLTEQIEANARLDQAATREEAQSDLLEPRIDRLASMLGVGAAGVLSVERFDAALAELRSRLARETEGADESLRVEQELERLLELVEGTEGSLVTTTDAVNVRLGPSTEEVRVAFLPAGVLLRIEEQRGPWSRVSSGSFEGWIFGELLAPVAPRLDESGPEPGSRSERLRLAAQTVARLDHERQLALQAAEERDRREEQQQLDALAPLEARLAQAESDLALLRGENDRLEAELVQEEQERQRLVRQVVDASSGGLEERVQGLAVWLPDAAAETVRVTAATNLRSGPGTEEERLALLPPGFEMVVLDRRENWVQVGYGALTGWMAVAFTESVEDPGRDGRGAQRLSADLVLDGVERLLSEAALVEPTDGEPEGVGGAGAPDDVLRPRDEAFKAEPSEILRGAADAIYQQFASARRRDALGFLSFYSEEFVPPEGSGVAWRDNMIDQIERGLYAGSQVQNLSLRRVSEDLVEASFLVDGADPEVVRRRRVDLARVDGKWRILVETSAESAERRD